MQKRIPAFAVAALIGAMAACGSDNDTTTPPVVSHVVTFDATMTGAQENPANTSSGSGTLHATLDTVTNVFTFDISFQGLTSNVTLGHIHGPAAATANAGAILNFATLPGGTFTTGATSGTVHGTATLVASNPISNTINGDSLKKLLLAGQTYANIHTSQNGGGEIRAQLIKKP